MHVDSARLNVRFKNNLENNIKMVLGRIWQ